jgi:hypothetical protein
MLGRLRMPLKECKETYMALSECAFPEVALSSKVYALSVTSFGNARFGEAIGNILDHALANIEKTPMEALLKEDDDHRKVPCKV